MRFSLLWSQSKIWLDYRWAQNFVVLESKGPITPPAQQYGIKIYDVFGLLANWYVSIYIPQNKTQEDLPEDITNTTSPSPLYQGTASKSID